MKENQNFFTGLSIKIIFAFLALAQSTNANSKESLELKNQRLSNSTHYIGFNINADSQQRESKIFTGGGLSFQHFFNNRLLLSAGFASMATNSDSNNYSYSKDHIDSHLLMFSISIKKLLYDKRGLFLGLGMGYGKLEQNAYLKKSTSSIYTANARFAPIFFTTGWMFNINNRLSVEIGLNIDAAELGFSSPVISSSSTLKSDQTLDSTLASEIQDEYNRGINFTNLFTTISFNTDLI